VIRLMLFIPFEIAIVFHPCPRSARRARRGSRAVVQNRQVESAAVPRYELRMYFSTPSKKRPHQIALRLPGPRPVTRHGTVAVAQAQEIATTPMQMQRQKIAAVPRAADRKPLPTSASLICALGH